MVPSIGLLKTASRFGDSIQIDGEADAEGGARGERREIVIRLGLVVEQIVDGRVQMQAAPDVMLEHQLPDGIALIDGSIARLGLSLCAS